MAPAPYSAPAAYYFSSTRLVGLEVFKGPAIKHGPNTIGGAVNTISRSVPTKDILALLTSVQVCAEHKKCTDMAMGHDTTVSCWKPHRSRVKVYGT